MRDKERGDRESTIQILCEIAKERKRLKDNMRFRERQKQKKEIESETGEGEMESAKKRECERDIVGETEELKREYGKQRKMD